ncbi:hypothetical protein AC578_5743 [Pseudocercospora eumusae]|nr:hypothetical protein AC578_5743 [Pseudocercospora eumusae]
MATLMKRLTCFTRGCDSGAGRSIIFMAPGQAASQIPVSSRASKSGPGNLLSEYDPRFLSFSNAYLCARAPLRLTAYEHHLQQPDSLIALGVSDTLPVHSTIIQPHAKRQQDVGYPRSASAGIQIHWAMICEIPAMLLFIAVAMPMQAIAGTLHVTQAESGPVDGNAPQAHNIKQPYRAV